MLNVVASASCSLPGSLPSAKPLVGVLLVVVGPVRRRPLLRRLHDAIDGHLHLRCDLSHGTSLGFLALLLLLHSCELPTTVMEPAEHPTVLFRAKARAHSQQPTDQHDGRELVQELEQVLGRVRLPAVRWPATHLSVDASPVCRHDEPPVGRFAPARVAAGLRLSSSANRAVLGGPAADTSQAARNGASPGKTGVHAPRLT